MSLNDQLFKKYSHIVSVYPYRVLIVLGLLLAALIAGLPNLIITNDIRVFFSDDNPQLNAFEKMEATYSQQDNIYFLILPDNNNIYTKQTLTLIYELTEAGWQIPYAQRVSSLTNYQHTYAVTDDEGESVITEYLVSNPDKLTDTDIARIKNIATNEISLLNNMTTEAGTATGVNVRLFIPDDEHLANETVTNHARALRDAFEQKYPNITIMLSGTTAANVTLGEAVAGDMQTLVIASYLIIIIGLWILLRSFIGTMLTLSVISFSILSTFGIYGWLGFTLTPVAGFVPSIVMTIAVADSVHMLVTYLYERRQGNDKQTALFESMRINTLPVFITSLTTIIGVMMLNFSDSPPYRDLGNMVAIGVAFAWMYSMLVIPALITVLPDKVKHTSTKTYKSWIDIDAFANWVINYRRYLLIGMSILVIGLASFIPQNVLTERWQEYYDDSFETRRALDALNDNLSGIHAVRYSLESGRTDGINDPVYMQAIDKFATWYREQPGVAYVSVVSDTIKRLNKNMHNDAKDYYRLPDRSDLTAQYLLMYELSLPLGLGLNDTITFDRSASQMVVILKRTHSAELLKQEQRAIKWARKNIPNVTVSEGSGLDMIFSHINERNITSLLKGTGIALVLISFLMIFVLRSFKLGIVSMLPNLAPAGLAYGSWAIFKGEIDLSASVVICMSLGIVVDDTVHFLTKYLRARREKNLSAEEGIRYAFHTVGVALTITTIVLVAGFMILTISHFSPTNTTGLLLAVTLSFALVVDFLLLPPLLMVWDRSR